MHRREFIRKSALAAGASFALKGTSLALSVRASESFFKRSANSKVNVAVIGCGGQGRFHLARYMAAKDCRVVAGADVNAKNAALAKQMADKHYADSSFKTYSDFREILADKSIDAVSITVPDHWHAYIAVAAINAGKHVYLEKPFAYSIYEGRKILEALKKNGGVVLQFGSQQRSMRHFRRAEYLVRNGYIGNAHTAIACSPYGHIGGEVEASPVPEGLDYDFWLGPARHVPYTAGRCDGTNPPGKGWYQMRDYSGGWVTAWGSHHVDSAQWIMGKDLEYPVRVEAEGEFPKSGVFDVAYKFYSEFRYAGGKKIIFTTPQTPYRGNVWIIGDEGWISAHRGGFEASNPALAAMHIPDERITPRGPIEDDYLSHFQNFLDAILFKIPTITTPSAACLSTEICHMCNIGMDLRRPLEWDATSLSFNDDAAANRMLRAPMRAPWTI